MSDTDVWALVDDLVTVLDDRMTSAGHPHALVTQEHLGTCSVRGCSARCRDYRALFVRACAWLDEHRVEAPVQLGLEEAV